MNEHDKKLRISTNIIEPALVYSNMDAAAAAGTGTTDGTSEVVVEDY